MKLSLGPRGVFGVGGFFGGVFGLDGGLDGTLGPGRVDGGLVGSVGIEFLVSIGLLFFQINAILL